MKNKKLNIIQLVLNVLLLLSFITFIVCIAMVVKADFFANVGKILHYGVYFIFERPWDAKTYITFFAGLLLFVGTMAWIVQNIVRRRKLLSYVAPIVLFSDVAFCLVRYHWRGTYEYWMAQPETHGWVYGAMLLLVIMTVLVLINTVLAIFNDRHHDKTKKSIPAEKEETRSVLVQDVTVVKEEKVEEKAEEEVVAQPEPEPAPVDKKKYDTLNPDVYGEIIRRTFIEKYDALDDDMKDKYMEIRRELLSYEGVRSRISKHCDSYRFKKEIQVKINIQGKTLKVFFALDPKDYADSKLPIIDVSDKKVYAEVPLLLKVKSDLSVKRAKKLIADVMAAHNIERSDEEPTEDRLAMKVYLDIIRRTFTEKLLKAPKDLQNKYDELKSYLLAYGVHARVSATCDSFRYKKELLIKMTIQGKTLKVFYALDPKQYEGTTIPVLDMSDRKTYADVPTLLKVKSDLSLRRAKLLADDLLLKGKELTQGEVVPHSHTRDLKKVKVD